MKKTRKFVLITLFVLVLMSAQVLAASCLDEIQSKKTSDFMNEIPSLSAKFAPPSADSLSGVSCDNKVKFYKNEVISVQVLMQDGSKQEFALTTKKGAVSSIVNGAAPKPTLRMSIGECEFDTFLRSDDKGGTFAYLYLQKKIQLSASGFFKKIKMAVVKMGMNIALKKIQVPTDIACTT